jgi:hypothetical protein
MSRIVALLSLLVVCALVIDVTDAISTCAPGITACGQLGQPCKLIGQKCATSGSVCNGGICGCQGGTWKNGAACTPNFSASGPATATACASTTTGYVVSSPLTFNHAWGTVTCTASSAVSTGSTTVVPAVTASNFVVSSSGVISLTNYKGTINPAGSVYVRFQCKDQGGSAASWVAITFNFNQKTNPTCTL